VFRIFSIRIEYRSTCIRLMIETDEFSITIDIP